MKTDNFASNGDYEGKFDSLKDKAIHFSRLICSL